MGTRGRVGEETNPEKPWWIHFPDWKVKGENFATCDICMVCQCFTWNFKTNGFRQLSNEVYSKTSRYSENQSHYSLFCSVWCT